VRVELFDVVSENESSKWKMLMRVKLQPHHMPTGNTKHWLGSPDGLRKEFPSFVRLEIAQWKEDSGFYLLYYPETGHGTDTWHQSLEDAMHQAEFEFKVKPDEWVREI